MELDKKIEAILFYKAEPMSISKLENILKISKEEILDNINILKERLKDRGIILLEKDNKITLGTSPLLSSLIEQLHKEEINKSLSKASLETLSIILYKKEAIRQEIDYIRGVNSSFTLRALSIRGLIEKEVSKEDSRRYIYKPSLELLSFMGLSDIEELPEFNKFNLILEKEKENNKEEIYEE